MNKAKKLLSLVQATRDNYIKLSPDPTMNISEEFTGGPGIYVKVDVLEKSASNILGLIKQYLGIIPDSSEWHITIMYSRNVTPSSDKITDALQYGIRSPYVASISNVEIFEGHDGQYLAFNLYSHVLQWMHDKWKDTGAEHSFPDYKAHMTIMKSPPENLESKVIDLNKYLESNQVMIQFTKEIIDNCKQD